MNELASNGLDAFELMRFIDIFGVPPERLPDGKDIDDVIGFLKAGKFREEFVKTCWRGFSRSYGRFFLWVKIYNASVSPKASHFKHAYTYEMTLRTVGDPTWFQRKYDNFRQGIIEAGRYMADGEDDGDTGNSFKQIT